MALDHDPNDVVLKTMAFTLVGDLLLIYHSSAPPPDAEWNQWVARTARGEHRGSLAISEGGAPNSRQRSRIAEVIRDNAPPFALLTDSAILRSIMTAFSWLLGGKQPMRAFASSDVEGALKWMRVQVPAQRVHQAIVRLRQALARGAAAKPS